MNNISATKLYIWRTMIMIVGTAINVTLCYVMHSLGLPLYLDTIGTIAVSVLTGCLWGTATAVSTHLINTVFLPQSVFFMCISVIVSLVSISLTSQKKLHKLKFVPLYILIIALISGVLGSGIQWILTGNPYLPGVTDAAAGIAGTGSGWYTALCILMEIGVNIIDKAICVFFAFLLYLAVPRTVREWLWKSNWRQKPLSTEKLEDLNRISVERYTLGGRIFSLVLITGVVLITVQMMVSLMLFEDTMNEEYSATVTQAAELVEETIDADMIDQYLNSGMTNGACDLKNYREAYKALERACRKMNGIQYMYVYQIREDGVYSVMDVDPAEEQTIIGKRLDFDSSFLPYKADLLKGKEIPVLESNDQYGHLMTAYVPIRNSSGKCVAYAGADVLYSVIEEYEKKYLTHSFLIIFGFFVFVTSAGLWVARYFMVRPIKSIALAVDDFVGEDGDQDQSTIDRKVNEFREMRVNTQDEVQFMYEALCRMMSGVAEQMRDLRRFSESTAQMQNGLIITMADMVESRDTDTGAHIQKTAAYVDIILDGLKKKGYYAEKMTPKFMSDAVISAPLHDVGKINVPDAVLQKPDKLTDEEYEIIKTHTTTGREMIERTIDTVHGENYLMEARNMAAYHHERWDGKGYPEGLHGELIPLSARVMAVADVFDALTAKRVYKPAFPIEKALQIIEEGAGTQFDPKCVEVFLEALPEVKAVLEKYNQPEEDTDQ